MNGSSLFEYNSAGKTLNLSLQWGCITVTNRNGIVTEVSGGFDNFSLQTEITFDQCTSSNNSGLVFDGTVTAEFNGNIDTNLIIPYLHNFDITGSLSVSGDLNSRMAFDLHFSLGDCIGKWICWSGTINDYDINELRDL